MLKINPLNKGFSQKLQDPEKKIKAINPPKKQRKYLSRKSHLQLKISTIAILKKYVHRGCTCRGHVA